MDIKNKLNQIHEGSVSQCFCTDSIRHCSLEHLMKVGLFLCNFFFLLASERPVKILLTNI